MVTPRRFLVCSTPAQGHAAPTLAIARRLVADGHDVVFFTTAHYRDRVTAVGARFVALAPEDDTHDLMMADPAREDTSRRGIRGLKDDLRRIFLDPMPGQFGGILEILHTFPADAVVADVMFLGAFPLALRPRATRPAVVCIGVSPLATTSRATAPFGLALQPGTSPLSRLRNTALNWTTEHIVLRDIQQLAQRRLAQTGAPPIAGYFIDHPTKVVDAYLQATVAGFEYPRPNLPDSVRFVGPLLPQPAVGFDRPVWWEELHAERPVVHVTQGTLDNADLHRLLIPAAAALGEEDLLVVATTGGPDPAPLRAGLPANVRLERFIPHDLLLPHVDVMITNGGYGGVQQALAHGVPLVVAGDSEEKPEVAARVRWSGTGIDLRTGKPSPRQLADAVRRILAEPAFGDRASALQAEIARTRPLDTVTEVLLTLAETTRPSGV
jgi:UDP:flavonoid glycosyltransferase YjiC (YdhE family)